MESTAKEMFSASPKTGLVLISLFYWLNYEYSAQTCNLYRKRAKMQIKCCVEILGTYLKWTCPDVTVILTKMHCTIYVINMPATCFVRYWKEMKKKILCNLQTTWQQMGISWFFGWMMGGSLEKVWLVVVLKNEKGKFAKIQGSMVKNPELSHWVPWGVRSNFPGHHWIVLELH